MLIILIAKFASSQDEKLEKKLKKILHAKEIVWDKFNEDGVLKAQSKSSGKWGMFQILDYEKRPKTLVPMRYDSLGFYDHSSDYTIVKKNGKYGVLASPWTNDIYPKLNVPCIYQEIKYTDDAWNIIAAKGDERWGYIDTETGDTLIPFVNYLYTDLPTPTSKMRKYPMRNYPEKLQKILDDPESVTEINLRGLNLTFLPEAIGKCVNAKVANLEKNNLSQLPNSFFSLKGLEVLLLGGNPSFTNFDSSFAKLTGLKELYIGTIIGSGSYSYSSESLEFSDNLAALVNLEKLVLFGHFYEYGFPKFVYGLPNLKSLSLLGTFGVGYRDLDFSKMKCRDSLRTLTIKTLETFSNMNASMKFFTHLEKIYVHTYNHKETPLWINDLKSLKLVKIIYYTPSKNRDGYYNGESAVYAYGGFYGDKEITIEERTDALVAWNDFIKKLEE